jgi:hypothetical protein
MRTGGPMPTPATTLIDPAPSPEEAAAIVAAIELFMRATAPAPAAPAATADPWLRAAILEGVERAGEGDLLDPWINT